MISAAAKSSGPWPSSASPAAPLPGPQRPRRRQPRGSSTRSSGLPRCSAPPVHLTDGEEPRAGARTAVRAQGAPCEPWPARPVPRVRIGRRDSESRPPVRRSARRHRPRVSSGCRPGRTATPGPIGGCRLRTRRGSRPLEGVGQASALWPAPTSPRRSSSLMRWASSSWSSRMMMRQAASMEVPWSTISRARAAIRN